MIMASTIAITSNDCHYRKDNSTDWHYSCEEGFWFLNDYIFFAMSVSRKLNVFLAPTLDILAHN